MRVALCVPGRFHAFDTAEQLHRGGHLRAVITPLPWLRARRHTALPRRIFRALSHVAAYRVLSERVPTRLGEVLRRPIVDCELFDRSAALVLPHDIDLCVAYAGSALHTVRTAKRRGARTVLERHSLHRAEQIRLLVEEHARYGVPFTSDPWVMERELAEYAEVDAICVPSSFVRRSFVTRGFAESKLIMAPLGVELSRFHPVPRTEPRFRVVFAGNFSLQKGVQTLLEAWRLLALGDAELVFAGWVEPRVLAALRPLELDGVRVLGSVPQETLKTLFSNSDVLCLPSIQDGFGTVMAQAMACGIPVLHSDHTGGADLVRPGIDGFAFPARDSHALAALIARLYEDRTLCKELGDNALSRVRELGGWDAYGQQIIAAYSALLRASTSRQD